MNIEKFKEELFLKSEKMGFTDYEIFIQLGNSFTVKINKGEIEQYSNSYVRGVGFRGKYNEQMGYSFSEKIDTSVIDELLINARDNSELIDTKDIEEIFEGSKKYNKVNTYNEELNYFTVEEKIELAKKMEKYALLEDERIKVVNYCVVSSGENEVIIYNSKGLTLSEKSNYAYAYIYVTAEENHDIKLFGDIWVGRDFKKLDIKNLAKEAVKGAVKQLGATTIKSGEYNIIIENKTAIDFINVFKSVFYAYSVQKGFSKLKGKLNEKISSDIVTLVDVGVYKDNISNISFDSEGVAKEETVLIEDGILKNYLYNLKTAKKDGVAPTGNGYRSSFKSTVGTSVTNFFIKEGEKSFDDLVKEMDNGIIITDLAGLHSGASSISGDFSLIASGYLVENGIVIKPIEQFTIAGNFFDVMLNIKGIANDLKFSIPSGGNVGSPSLFIGKLMVSGE